MENKKNCQKMAKKLKCRIIENKNGQKCKLSRKRATNLYLKKTMKKWAK